MKETTRGEFQEAEKAKVNVVKDGTHGRGSAFEFWGEIREEEVGWLLLFPVRSADWG